MANVLWVGMVSVSFWKLCCRLGNTSLSYLLRYFGSAQLLKSSYSASGKFRIRMTWCLLPSLLQSKAEKIWLLGMSPGKYLPCVQFRWIHLLHYCGWSIQYMSCCAVYATTEVIIKFLMQSLDDFSLVNCSWFAKFTKLSSRQSFLLRACIRYAIICS